ncbi:MAG: helix-turn-helix transcriptional regulator [Flavobacteriaceae bacterium]
MSKNNDKRAFISLSDEEDFKILHAENTASCQQVFSHAVQETLLQFHFCTRGSAVFSYHQGNYIQRLTASSSNLLYNPQLVLPIDVEMQTDTEVLILLISIQKFHKLFSQDAEHISFLSPTNISKKYYHSKEISPAMMVVLKQMAYSKIHPSMLPLYLKAKVYELLSLYFNVNAETAVEQCPFLADETNVQKIRQAKTIILEHMAEPPSLQELADEIGLSLKKLKEGFKQLYGDTVYGYLLDHKMEEARRMLNAQQHNVNEVGLKLGYSTSSHFIAAFKKKYGTTPKKYLMSLSS